MTRGGDIKSDLAPAGLVSKTRLVGKADKINGNRLWGIPLRILLRVAQNGSDLGNSRIPVIRADKGTEIKVTGNVALLSKHSHRQPGQTEESGAMWFILSP
jgi:hypothetical protein